MTEGKAGDPEKHWETTKRRYVGAIALVTLGLAVAGTMDRTTGGVILLTGWLAGIVGLHRLGRAGSTPRS